VRKQKLLFGLIVVILLILIGLFIAISQKTSSSDNLKIINLSEVTRSVFYSPQYVAIQKGFFAKNGIKIELTTGQGADAVMTSVLSNQVDIGFAGPEASIYVYKEGKEDYTEVFAQLTKKDGSFLVSKEDTDNFNWEDLKGKTIIPGRKGGVPYMTLEYVLKKNGINAEFSAGLSLGEYTALIEDGVFDFETGVKLVQKRGEIMQNLTPQGNWKMAAILGLEAEKVQEACNQVQGFAVPANFNTIGQIVISGEEALTI